MPGIVADTHAAIWFLMRSPRLSPAALTALRGTVATGDTIHVSAVSLVETTYRVEKGRVPDDALDRLKAALADPDSAFLVAPLDLAVANAVARIPRIQVPELPDRIIAATALHLGLPLVTRDHKIQATALTTIW